MSYIRIQNFEGDDLVTICLSTGKVEIQSKESIGDAAYAFWDAVHTMFGRSPQEDITILGGKEEKKGNFVSSELSADFLDLPIDDSTRDYYEKYRDIRTEVDEVKALENVDRVKRDFKRLQHEQRVKEYNQMPSHNIDVATTADKLPGSIYAPPDQYDQYTCPSPYYEVSMGYSDEEYDPDIKVVDHWDGWAEQQAELDLVDPDTERDFYEFEGGGIPEGRVNMIHGKEDLAKVLSQGNTAEGQNIDVDKLREQVDYALSNPEHSLTLQQVYDTGQVVDLDAPIDIVIRTPKKP